MHVFGLSWSGWLLWWAISCGVSTRCLNMWSYGTDGPLRRFRHDRRLFRTVVPATAAVIGTLAWSWGTYGTAAANLVLAAAALRPDLMRRQRWLTRLLGDRRSMAAAFVLVPVAIVLIAPGSLAERVQVAGGYQLIAGFFGLLAGAWGGDRSADTWQWLTICLSVDLLLGAGALALAAAPIVVLEAMALTMDLTKLSRKVAITQHRPVDVVVARRRPDTTVAAELEQQPRLLGALPADAGSRRIDHQVTLRIEPKGDDFVFFGVARRPR